MHSMHSRPPPVSDEAERLKSLHSYQLLDTLPEQALDDLTALAAHICRAPISLVSLVAEERQWFKSKVGIETNETPREISFCAHTLNTREMLIVDDASCDERFARNPLVTEEPHIRFYAGAPLISPSNHVLGTLCVIDHEPRTLSPSQLEALQVLSRQVMAQIELRRQTRNLQQSESSFRNVFEHAATGICVIDLDSGSFVKTNRHFCDFLGYSESELLNLKLTSVIHPDDLEKSLQLKEALQSGARSGGRMEKRYIRKDNQEVWANVTISARNAHESDHHICIATIEDITEQKAAEKLTQMHNQVLRMIASGESLATTLDEILRVIGKHSPDTPCSILLLDQSGEHLIHGSAIGLDEAYIQAIDGVKIGPYVGSCGTAAFLKKPIYVEDIFRNEYWKDYRELARRHGLKACWSTPILNADNELLGTFAIYANEPGLPTELQQGLIELTTQTAAIAISRDRNVATLRASEERYRTTMDKMMEGCQLIGFDWRYLYLNEKVADHNRRPNAELLDRTVQDAWPGIEDTQAFSILKRCMDDRVEIREELEFVYPDGDHGWFEVRCQPVPEGIFLLSIDITERKTAALALMESELKFATTFDVSPVPMFLSDSTGKYLDVNQNACDLLGYTKEEFVGKTALQMGLCNETMIKLHDKLRAQHGINLKGVELMLLAKNGSPKYLLFSQEYITIGAQQACLSVGVDITARKKTDDALLEAQRNLSSIIQSVDGIVWEADAHTFQFSYVSPQAERILGYSISEWTDKDGFWKKHIHSEDIEEAVAHRIKCTQQGLDHEFEYRMRKNDGNYLLLRDIVTVISVDGNPIKLRGLMVDVTEKRLLHERMRESQKMEAVGQLAGGVAHDFNNILAAMMMQAELIINTDGLPESARNLVGEMKAATKRAAALTSQLLAFGRRQVLQKKSISINDSVSNISRMLLRVLPENVKLDIQLSQHALYANADSGMFDQVLLNLVVNARDAMPHGGEITIVCTDVKLSAEEAAGIMGGSKGDYIRVSVTDTGAGIPAKLLPHLFEPFFSTKEVGKGTGLGLATVFGILKQHNGAIQVTSTLEQGSTFHTYWPKEAEPPRITQQHETDKPVSGGQETILIVEDESSVRVMTKMLLEKHGYRVLEAENGVAALDLWNKRDATIHLVLTDMVMPEGISGKTLADTLRQDQPQLKVVFTSGYSPELEGRGFQLLPGQRFVPKPCQIQELLDAVRNCLDEVMPKTS